MSTLRRARHFCGKALLAVLHRGLLSLALLLVGGCTQQLRFQTIDSFSGKAVPSAKITAKRVTSFSYFFREQRQREIGSTDVTGFIKVTGITKHDVLRFSAPGYYEATAALAEGGKIGVAWPYSTPLSAWVQPCVTTTNRDSVTLVPLMPLPIGH